MKILGVSDNEVDVLYSPQITKRFSDIDLILGCGDLRFFYLEYILSMLNKPFFFVHGNHYYGPPPSTPAGEESVWTYSNIHRRVVEANGLLIAGIEGSIRYNLGPYQYTQEEMWGHVFHLVPQLMVNKTKFNRYLDILITHAPPWGIHDKDDLPHHGSKAFRWLIKVFKPRLHFHGHIHLYSQDAPRETRINKTRVVNVYAFRTVELLEPKSKKEKSD
ncbi:MAG: metallophosphoesterase [Anaerolineaceae bacterium]|nr:metallophosphoesterase [Anaerolineaceae bacterium]MBN2676471.1 metallophosphoesterase [Anaerolineaceae bacterium]